MTETTRTDPGSTMRLVIGIYLLLIGALALADNLGYAVPGKLWSYWPFLLIGLGVMKIASPSGSENRRGGLWLITAGLYGWISIWHLFGLEWGTAWPIFLVAAGVGIVFDDFFPRRCRRRLEPEV